MKNYDEMFQRVLARREEYEKKKKRRAVIIKRTAAAVLGTAAVLGIGLTTFVLRPPKKPVPNPSGIITETETTSAETSSVQSQPRTTAAQAVTKGQTTTTSIVTSTTVATSSSARKTSSTAHTTTAKSQTSTSAVHTTVTTVHTTATECHTTAATVTTTTAQTSILLTTQTEATAPTTTVSTTTAVITTYATTTPVQYTQRPPRTTTISEGRYNGHNYTTVTVGNSPTVYVKVKNEYPYFDKYIKAAFIYEVDSDPRISDTASLNMINGVSDKCAFMMFFSSIGAHPVYLNTEYEPETLGDLLDDMGLSGHMSFGEQNARFLNEDEHFDIDGERIIAVLEDCREAVNTKEKVSAFTRDITLDADIDYMDIDTSFYISKQGYISTNITDRGATFYIGEEKAKSCIEYLLGD